MDKLEQIATKCAEEIYECLGIQTPVHAIIESIQKAMTEYKDFKEDADPYKDQTFKMFYEDKYGKKVGRVVAYRHWKKLKKAEIERILETVDDFVRANPDPQYRPHPATYLSQRRWEDEISPKKPRTFSDEVKRNSWSYDASSKDTV